MSYPAYPALLQKGLRHWAALGLACLGLLPGGHSFGQGTELKTLCADRAAVERVYYNHRLGEKPSFEQALPAAAIEQMVRFDAHKEAVLKNVYGTEVTPAQLQAEVQRIDATTRAPDTLAELKAALGNDPERFARAIAKPLLVERQLRARFENDDQLHAAQRQAAEKVRQELLAAKKGGEALEKSLARLRAVPSASCHEVVWQMVPRPIPQENQPARPQVPAGPASGVATSGAYRVEATVQMAQVLSPPPQQEREDVKLYFEDLPRELQPVLLAQLRQPG
ncbi:MAG TPA: hypothetical protein VNT26_01750, partial [Candidatus Sulfotelmatobacter sp.]|nr:hypothetical protein [Candidatus Sulfotelmatobacter sp.]